MKKFDGNFDNSVFKGYKIEGGKKVNVAEGRFERVFELMQLDSPSALSPVVGKLGMRDINVEKYLNEEKIVYVIEYLGKDSDLL